MRRVERSDREYPALLREIADAPDALYVRGALLERDALAIAVVGSRQATSYGTGVAEELGRELAARGVTIVSGLARGIDSAAHRGALRAGGRTIAVLGSGADVIYPSEHRPLAAEIEASGALVSQFAPGTRPLAYRFPVRNRVIAGLALGVVVVEAAEKSGALITARLAGELGREVMAVPGRVTSAASRGAHALIRDGAALVESWTDVVAQLPARWRACVSAEGPDADGGAASCGDAEADAALVLAAVGDEERTLDAVVERSGLASGRAAAVLLELELAGRIRQLAGSRFVTAGRG
ncbi:MAG TPA: DNA-processing protein DprA [Candidatus Methylomirabilis sp.]|nr:DNA-processing protein DprA [Candidatus Methylomirabilis sp.]